jgi:hypothetical protein
VRGEAQVAAVTCLCCGAAAAGALPIDAEVYAELRATGAFEQMGMDADEVRGKSADQQQPGAFVVVPVVSVF